VLALLDGAPGALGQLDREGNPHHAGFRHALHAEARVAEDLQHAPVVRQRVGGKAANPVRAGDHRQVLQHQRADAPALVRICDHECDLGLIAIWGAVVAGQRHDLVPERGNQAHVRVVVGVGKVAQHGRRKLRHGREEAQVDRLVGELLMECHEVVGIRRSRRSDMDGTAVCEDDVALPA
jgi:hypothetical protein